MIHVLKVIPNSEAEEHFMNLLKHTSCKRVVCKLSSITGLPYNEYEITDETYMEIQNYLKTQRV